MHFEKLNEANFRCHDIRNNDIVPVGGSYTGALNLAVIADLTQFEPFFQTVAEKATSLLQSPTTKAWLSQICPDMISPFWHICIPSIIRSAKHTPICPPTQKIEHNSTIRIRRKLYPKPTKPVSVNAPK